MKTGFECMYCGADEEDAELIETEQPLEHLCVDCMNSIEALQDMNKKLRSELSAVKQERDGMRNCHNCLHTQYSSGNCAAWSHGECSDSYEDGETKLKHWQPRKGQS